MLRIIYLYNFCVGKKVFVWCFFCYIFALCSFRFFAIFLYENIVIKINACALFVVSLPIEIGNGFGLFSINSLLFFFLSPAIH